MQEKIHYRDIMKLGFTEEKCHDSVYFDIFGYDYSIITYNLTKKIYLDWVKETQLCEMVRIDSQYNIKKRMPIKNMAHLKEIIDFFSDEKSQIIEINYSA